MGEDLPCCSNKVQPVSFRKRRCEHQPTDKAYFSDSGGKPFLRVLPTKWRWKPYGIDTKRNYVTVTLVYSTCDGWLAVERILKSRVWDKIPAFRRYLNFLWTKCAKEAVRSVLPFRYNPGLWPTDRLTDKHGPSLMPRYSRTGCKTDGKPVDVIQFRAYC